jgi:hypothetical protein
VTIQIIAPSLIFLYTISRGCRAVVSPVRTAPARSPPHPGMFHPCSRRSRSSHPPPTPGCTGPLLLLLLLLLLPASSPETMTSPSDRRSNGSAECCHSQQPEQALDNRRHRNDSRRCHREGRISGPRPILEGTHSAREPKDPLPDAYSTCRCMIRWHDRRGDAIPPLPHHIALHCTTEFFERVAA